MSFGQNFRDDPTANPRTAGVIGGTLNAVWITIMNLLYRKLAVYLNTLENHRTETANEDALIMKTFLFQFANSYAALFYIAFLKGLETVTLFGAFGHLNDATGKPYTDACGVVGTEPFSNVAETCDESPDSSCRYVFVRTDCMGALWIQMIIYTLVKPAYEMLFFGFLLPIAMRKFNQFRLKKAMKQLQQAWDDAVAAEPTQREGPSPPNCRGARRTSSSTSTPASGGPSRSGPANAASKRSQPKE